MLKNIYVKLFIVLVIGVVVGYFLKDEKVITVEKEKIVYKYIKGDTITQKPDGTIVVQNGTINSTEHSNEYSKTEINKSNFVISPIVGINRNISYGIMVQKDVWGRIGLTAGGLYTPSISNSMVLVGLSVKF
jgi:hypothetical protein